MRQNTVWPMVSVWHPAIRIALASLLVLYGVFFSQTAAGSKPAELKNHADFYLALKDYTRVYVDKHALLTIDEIINRDELFSAVATPYIDFGGVMRGRAWLKTSLHYTSPNTASPNTASVNTASINNNPSTHTASLTQSIWRFDINRQYYREADVYVLRKGKQPEHILHSRLSHSFYTRPVADRMLGVDIALNPGETVDLYIAIRADASTFMPLGVGNVEAILKRHTKEHSLNVVLNGMLLSFVVAALLLIPVIGWRIALSFSLYLLGGLAYIAHADGYTFVHLWPNHMTWNDPMNLSLMATMPIFGLLFSRELFNFQATHPRLDRFILLYCAVACAVVFSAYWLYQWPSTKVIGYLVPPTGSIAQIAAAVIAYRSNKPGASAYAVGAGFILCSFTYAVLANTLTGQFNQDITLDFGHFALIIEGAAFIAAIAIRLTRIKKERDRALLAELSITREKLHLSTQLQQARQDFYAAQQLADQRRSQLNTVGHDIRQPLISLRTALDNMGGPDEDTIQQIRKSFDYLEKLTLENLFGKNAAATDVSETSDIETFHLSVVLDNVSAMFSNEARRQGIAFRYRPQDVSVVSDPIALMRIVSNLVSNAIQHSEATGLLLAARKRGSCVQIEVRDNGKGMTQQDALKYRQAHTKSSDSEGSGLGLAIVSTLTNKLNLPFTVCTRPGKGSAFFIQVPLADG